MNTALILGKWSHFPDYDDPAWDGLDSEQVGNECDNIAAELERLAGILSASEFFTLAKMFRNDQSYMDLDFVYRSLIEHMPDYPMKELFLDSSDNEFIQELRIRCWNGKVFPPLQELPILSAMIFRMFRCDNLEKQKMSKFASKEELKSLTPHEMMLLKEVVEAWSIKGIN